MKVFAIFYATDEETNIFRTEWTTSSQFKSKEYESIECAYAANPIGVALGERVIRRTSSAEHWGHTFTFVNELERESFISIGKWKAKGSDIAKYCTKNFKNNEKLELPSINEESDQWGVYSLIHFYDPNGEKESIYVSSLGRVADYLLYYSSFDSWKEVKLSFQVQALQKKINELEAHNKALESQLKVNKEAN